MAVVKLEQGGTVTFSQRGRIFLMNSATVPVDVRFRGLDDEWLESHSLVTGDRVEFGKDFHAVELSSDKNQTINFDIGYGLISRAESVSLRGASAADTEVISLAKGRTVLVPANRNRTSLLIKPTLPIVVCLGVDDKAQGFPVGVGESIELKNGTEVIVYTDADNAKAYVLQEVM